MFVNIPKKYDPENLSQEEAHQLIEAKVEKEKNRYIQKWDKEKIALENGRWGPFIRNGKKKFTIPKIDGNKITSDQAKELSLEDVKKIMDGEVPEKLKTLLTQTETES
jgi:DNA topoisomerase-1